MAIIGKADGKRPTLASVAESDRALFKLVKAIVADLLEDRELSKIVREWQDWFAPYVSTTSRAGVSANMTSGGGPSAARVNCLQVRGPYEHDFSEKRQYKPDFYLPEHSIYIEHFGIRAEEAPFVDNAGNGLEAQDPCQIRRF